MVASARATNSALCPFDKHRVCFSADGRCATIGVGAHAGGPGLHVGFPRHLCHFGQTLEKLVRPAQGPSGISGCFNETGLQLFYRVQFQPAVVGRLQKGLGSGASHIRPRATPAVPAWRTLK